MYEPDFEEWVGVHLWGRRSVLGGTTLVKWNVCCVQDGGEQLLSMGHGVCIATRKTCQGCVAKGFACLAQEVGCRDPLECVRARVIRFAFQKEGWCQCWEVDGREGQTLVPVRGGHYACPSSRPGFGVGQGFGRGGFRHERWITESIGAAVGMRRGKREEKQMVLRFLSPGAHMDDETTN